MDVHPAPMPQGQRPPPFLPPITSIGAGGDSWGDEDHLGRLLNKYGDALERITQLSRWSVEVLGLRAELDKRYRTLMQVAQPRKPALAFRIELGQLLAVSKYAELEDAFFSQKDHFDDSIALSLETGWVGSTDPNTPKVIGDVRTTLTEIYLELRNRIWSDVTEDKSYARDVVDRVNDAFDHLFSITGPDEFAWGDWINSLSEAARVIKDRAYTLASI